MSNGNQEKAIEWAKHNFHYVVALVEGTLSFKHMLHAWKKNEFLKACFYGFLSGFSYTIFGAFSVTVPIVGPFISTFLVVAGTAMMIMSACLTVLVVLLTLLSKPSSK